jgi:hypothetical protein
MLFIFLNLPKSLLCCPVDDLKADRKVIVLVNHSLDDKFDRCIIYYPTPLKFQGNQTEIYFFLKYFCDI